MLPIFLIVLAQRADAKTIIADAVKKIGSVTSLTVTLVSTTEEFPRKQAVDYAYRKGGYIRAESGGVTWVANPKSAWAFSPRKKQYQSVPASNWGDLSKALGLDLIDSLPILNGPTRVTCHGLHALRIELDGRKALTKETKFFAFFDGATHLPLGISANLGSITQVQIFEHLKLNPKLPDSLFAFVPPTGWTKLTTGHLSP